QSRRQPLRNGGGKIVLGGVAAQVHKRQNHHRKARRVGSGLGRLCRFDAKPESTRDQYDPRNARGEQGAVHSVSGRSRCFAPGNGKASAARATGGPRILGKIGSLRRLPLTCPQQSATLRLVPAAGLVWSFGGAVTEQRVQRRLAAILAADVVGYSAMMQRAEEATYAE